MRRVRVFLIKIILIQAMIITGVFLYTKGKLWVLTVLITALILSLWIR